MLVHDLRHARASGLRRRVAIAWLRDAARRVVRFHVPSAATRSELVALVPAALDKVDVVPNAVVVPDDPAATHLPPGIAPGFVFAAGHAEPRKDWAFVAGLAAALAPAGVRVVRAGRGKTPDPHVVDLGVVRDAVRDALFHAALAVVAPSRLEGFGLVPLEALACGAHVIASDVPAHREVLGTAADFFPPGDVTAALALVRAAGGAPASARVARAAAARARAASFSPSRSADAFEASLRAIGL
jgi:glycosyltransferase involved in cell wall biosynthesis